MIIAWGDFLKEVEKIKFLWVGETHGIVNNYRAYKLLIKKIIPFGFNTIAMEMPEDLAKFSRKNFLKYANYFDGRFSEDSLKFFEWLDGLGGIKILCFDVRTPDATQKLGEEQMARNLLSKIDNREKVLVLTGSFHSEINKQQEVLPMAGIVKKKFGEKLLVMDFKYKEGRFYNFGLRKFTRKFHHFDDNSLTFGKITLNERGKVSAKYFFHCSGAVPVKLLKSTLKERLGNLYKQDQEQRTNWKWDSPNFLKEVSKRDRDRRFEIKWLLSREKEFDGEDYYHAAMVYQHGDMTNDYKKANLLAKKSMDKGYDPAKWLYAATLDRYLLSQRKSQKYGTQYKRNKDGKYELLPLDSMITDAQRKELNVPALKEMEQRIKDLNKNSQ